MGNGDQQHGSEWTQQIGLVLLTKRLVETGSKESSDDN